MGLAQATFVWAALLVFSKGLIPTVLTGGDSSVVSLEEGLGIYQLLAAAIYIGVVVQAAMRPGPFLRTARGVAWMGVLCGVALCSVAWSVSPLITLRRAGAVCGTTAFAVYLTAYVDRDRLRILLELLIAFAAVAGLALVFLMPTYGVHNDLHDGAWRGIFLHKNACGQFMALGLVLLISGAREQTSHRYWRLTAATPCLVMLVGTGSRTAWVATPLLLVLALTQRTKSAWWWSMALGATALGGFLYANGTIGTLLDALGRDDSLSGRLPLWQLVVDDIYLRPWLGYGYGAYWLGQAGNGAAGWAALGWLDSPKHSHNALLDVTVELGVIGALAFLAAVVSGVRRLWRSRLDEGTPGWLLATFVGVALFGITGGDMFVQNSLYWILLVSTAAQPVATRGEARMRHTAIPSVRVVAARSSVA